MRTDKSSIITRRTSTSQPDWRADLSASVTDPETLLRLLGLDRSLLPAARAAAQNFGLRVPRDFIARMAHGDPRDPLLLQILPLQAELDEIRGFGPDPVGDHNAELRPGLLRKYAGRALLIASGACGVNCRYCFRRQFPYAGHSAATGRWQASVEAIGADPTIREVILSGGDPLVLPDDQLASLTSALAGIPHVHSFRIHTRMPVVLPTRVDAGLVRWLASIPVPVTIVVHANHPREIDTNVAAALGRMRAAGGHVLNQAVLLHGVNDDPDTLVALSETLFAAGVLPYYLHLLDRVTGAAHFDVSENRARQLLWEVARRLPGYLVPRLVREIAGHPFKAPLSPLPPDETFEAEPMPHPL